MLCSPLRVEQIEMFVDLQDELMAAFRSQFPGAKDFTWLLDFPRRGMVAIGRDSWSFHRHGCGLRFMREYPAPHLVVDVSENVAETSFFSPWRLVDFLESCGERVEIADLEKALESLVTALRLRSVEGGYLAEPRAHIPEGSGTKPV